MTLDFYEKNADDFINSTLNVDVSDLYSLFLKDLKKGDSVLDVGCGSGRDSLAFKEMGFNVTSIDASMAMASFATKLLGQEVKCISFNQINFIDEFHGIWACASLLHVKKNELQDILKLLATALKVNGHLYMSFKYGYGEREATDGRFFLDLNESLLHEILNPIANLSMKYIWISDDKRENKKSDKWLNIILSKNS